MAQDLKITKLTVHDRHVEVVFDHPDEDLPVVGLLDRTAFADRAVRYGYDLDDPELTVKLLRHVLHEQITPAPEAVRNDARYRFGELTTGLEPADAVFRWVLSDKQRAELAKLDVGQHLERARLTRMLGRPHPGLTGRRL